MSRGAKRAGATGIFAQSAIFALSALIVKTHHLSQAINLPQPLFRCFSATMMYLSYMEASGR
jgi:hypothetical protein